ncbi:MAG: hypothetical protein ABIF10_04580 [Candidatus Woesearchaeota archaeon]
MDTKAQISHHMVIWILRIIFLIIVIATVSLLIYKYIQTEVNIFDVESNLFVYQFLYSKSGLSYYDSSTGEFNAGVIDCSSDLEDKLKGFVSENVAARMVLRSLEFEDYNTFYFNKRDFDNWFVVSKFQGPGAAKTLNKRLYVLCKNQDLVYPAWLDIVVVMSNS